MKRKKKAKFKLAVNALALVGAYLIVTGVWGHFTSTYIEVGRQQVLAEKQRFVNNRVNAQVMDSRLEALKEGTMETLPLLVKRVKDYINE